MSKDTENSLCGFNTTYKKQSDSIFRELQDVSYECTHEAEQGSTFCVLHQPQPNHSTQEQKKAKLQQLVAQAGFELVGVHTDSLPVQKHYSEHVTIAGCVFSQNIDMKECTFAKTLSLAGNRFLSGFDADKIHCSASADFNSTQFDGKADFSDAQFDGHAYFSDAQFEGHAYFRDAQFDGEAYFRDAQFDGEAYFRDAQFDGHAYFRYAQFDGYADFRGVQFDGDADFRDAQFERHADFRYAQFEGHADFRSAQFDGDADFSDAQFDGDADFRDAQFDGDADFSCIISTTTLNIQSAKFAQSITCHTSILANLQSAQATGALNFSQCCIAQWTVGEVPTETSVWITNTHPILSSKNMDSLIQTRADTFTERAKQRDKKIEALQSATNESHLSDEQRQRHKKKIQKYQSIADKKRNWKTTITERLQTMAPNWDLSAANLQKFTFIDCDLSHANFLSSKIDGIHFDGCNFNTKYKQTRLHGDDANALEPIDDKKLQNLRDMYFRFKQYFESRHNYPLAGQFHKRELQLRLLDTDTTGAEKLILHLYGFTSDFGLRWTQVLRCVFLWILLCLMLLVLFDPMVYDRGGLGVDYAGYSKTLLNSVVPTSLTKAIGISNPIDEAKPTLNLLQQVLLFVYYIGFYSLTALFILCLRRNFKR